MGLLLASDSSYIDYKDSSVPIFIILSYPFNESCFLLWGHHIYYIASTFWVPFRERSKARGWPLLFQV
jgi:hypothetical protein